MLAELITIGDEILIGQIVDTNSAWMATELNKIGIKVKQISSVSDDVNHILTALAEAENRADIILITGGLGPTKDDITKKTLAKYFNCDEFVLHQPTLAIVEGIFAKYNAPLLESNIQQAMVPSCCEVILNQQGTAPAMLFKNKNKIFVSMPGVPYEMKNIMTSSVIPLIQEKYNLPAVYHQTILTAGVGESFLAAQLESVEDTLPPYIKLAYLPKLGSVRLRLSTLEHASPEIIEELNSFTNKIIELIPDHWVAKEDLPIEKVILNLMDSQGLTLSVAESCTGGAIAQALTQHTGSSTVFMGGGVVYSNNLKIKLLGVNAQTLDNFGAVSQETVTEMAQGAIQKFDTDYSIAVSGIAGPTGGTADKPVGTVWISVANKEKSIVKKFTFTNKRLQNIDRSVMAAFTMLFRFLKDDGY